MNKIVCFVLSLFFALNSLVASAEEDPYDKLGIIEPSLEHQALPFTLKDLNGNEVSLSDYKGKAILINFWATWCGPCIQEMPAIEKLYNIFKDKGFVVLAVSIDQGGIDIVKSFVEKHHLTFPVLLDSSHKVWKEYNVTGIPASYLISPKGVVKGFAIGSREWDSDTAMELIRNLIQDKR